jgi:hypothetical protein
MRFELMTSSLPRRRSTPELRGQRARIGAGDEIRTRDPQLGRLMLYQLSYTRSRKDEGGRQKDEVLLVTHCNLFILHPSYFILNSVVQGAGFEPA